MATNQQTPVEEAAERVAETLPGLAAVSKMVAIADFEERQAAHLRHIEDDHRRGAEIIRTMAGLETKPSEPHGKGKKMSNFLVCGDVQGDRAIEALRSVFQEQGPAPMSAPEAQPVAPVAPEPQPVPFHLPRPAEDPAWKTWLKRAAMVAGGGLAGAGGIAGYNALTAPDEQPPVIEQPAFVDSYMEYGVEVLPPEAPP